MTRRIGEWLTTRKATTSAVILALLVSVITVWPGLGYVSPAQATAHCAATTSTSTAQENAIRDGVAGSHFYPSPSDSHIQVWANTLTSTCGKSLTVHVGSRQRWKVQLWRTGWYRGHLGRQVWSSNWQTPTTSLIHPIRSQVGYASSSYGFVTASGGGAITLPITAADYPGLYFVRAINATGFKADSPVVIASTRARSSRLFVVSISTAVMYNDWGGASAYKVSYVPAALARQARNPHQLYQHDARRVSTQKPWSAFGGLAHGDLALLSWIESTNRNIDYASDLELSTITTAQLDAYKMLAFGQHSEYWTSAARTTMLESIHDGTNVAFFGSNNLYWKERTTTSGGTTTSLNVDKVHDVDKWNHNPATAEDHVLGGGTACVHSYGGKLLVTDPTNTLFRGLRSSQLTHVPGLYSDEIDSRDNSMSIPTLVLARSESALCAHPDAGRGSYAETTIARQPSGAVVLDVAGMGFACSTLSAKSCPVDFKATGSTTLFSRIFIGNVLDEFVGRVRI